MGQPLFAESAPARKIIIRARRECQRAVLRAVISHIKSPARTFVRIWPAEILIPLEAYLNHSLETTTKEGALFSQESVENDAHTISLKKNKKKRQRRIWRFY